MARRHSHTYTVTHCLCVDLFTFANKIYRYAYKCVFFMLKLNAI